MKGEAWENWARHPETQRFLEALRETVRLGQQSWLNRELEDENPHTWAVKNAAALAVAGYAETWVNPIEALTKERQEEE